MANKFQQGALQRLQQEQENNKKIPDHSAKQAEGYNIPEPESRAKPAAAEKEIRHMDSVPDLDLTDFLEIEPRREAKNKTFYLDVEVIEAISAAARKQNVADSKLVNDVLRRVLGIRR